MCISRVDIRTAYDAHDFLRALGFDDFDIREFGELLNEDENEDLAYKHEQLKEEFACYERALDAAQGVLNDVMNLCQELAERQRSAQGRRALESVYKLVYESEAV